VIVISISNLQKKRLVANGGDISSRVGKILQNLLESNDKANSELYTWICEAVFVYLSSRCFQHQVIARAGENMKYKPIGANGYCGYESFRQGYMNAVGRPLTGKASLSQHHTHASILTDRKMKSHTVYCKNRIHKFSCQTLMFTAVMTVVRIYNPNFTFCVFILFVLF